MDILLINGSPRKNGNTQMILNLYAEMLQKQENTTHTDMISLAEQNIEFCHGCRLCMESTEMLCPCRDSVRNIETRMNAADMIIVGTPVYVEDVSGLTKVWIDRMAYHCHRPFLNGKKVFLFTTSGANASRHAMKTLQHAFLAWGATVVRGENFSMGGRMQAEAVSEKYEVQIREQIQKILQWQKADQISLFSLIAFRVQKGFWIKKGTEADSVDYQYWKKNGWLEKSTLYYHPAEVNPLKCCIAALIGKLIGQILY